jgi:LacI family transcriptional regulator
MESGVSHDLPLKEIALQAGVSLATVDRVVNRRGQVRAATIRRVEAAIDELHRQNAEAAVSGRRLVIDLVMDAPARFCQAVRVAMEAELPGLRPANVRCRFHMDNEMGPERIGKLLGRIARRGSHGVIIKAPDTADMRDAVARLLAANIPVVALVTDFSVMFDVPYVGMDNHQAGATAAWALAGAAGRKPLGAVLATSSSDAFRGERERLSAFRRTVGRFAPDVAIIALAGGYGSDRQTGQLVGEALAANASINAVYSAGGGNRAILRAFHGAERPLAAFIAHDLDADNSALLADGHIDVVIHHDLRRDVRTAVQLVLRHHRMLPAEFATAPSRVEIVTRYNMP